jgi:hypothetical protein
MSKAFESACSKLQIDGDAREIVAARIVELARLGETDPEKLVARVVKEASQPL